VVKSVITKSGGFKWWTRKLTTESADKINSVPQKSLLTTSFIIILSCHVLYSKYQLSKKFIQKIFSYTRCIIIGHEQGTNVITMGCVRVLEHEGSIPAYRSPSLTPVLSQMNPFRLLQPYFLKMNFNIFLACRLWLDCFEHSLPFRLLSQNCVHISNVSHTFYMSCPSQTHWFNHPNNRLIWLYIYE
jgi:hypothetical protein